MGSASSVEAHKDLCGASSSGDVALLRDALEAGAPVNRLEGGKTALAYAAEAGRVDVIDLLLIHGADINKQCECGRTALWYAVYQGRLHAARRLLQAGARANHTDGNGCCAVAVACMELPVLLSCIPLSYLTDIGSIDQRSVDIVDLLIDAGAHVDTSDNHGATPLLTAAANGHIDIVHRLLGLGADSNHVDKEGCTFLMYAAKCPTTDAITRLALGMGALVNQQDAKGRTPLMHAARHGHDNCVRLLLDAGSLVDAVDTAGWTALHFAINNFVWANFRSLTPAAPYILLRAGASANHATSKGTTPLARACGIGALDECTVKCHWCMVLRTGDLTVVSELLHAGADVNHADKAGHTALMNVLEFRYWEHNYVSVVLALIIWGASITQRSTLGQTALSFANGDGLSALLRQYASQSAEDVAVTRTRQSLLIAARHGEVDHVRTALTAGAAVNWRDECGMSALMYAARYGHADVVDILVASGVNVNQCGGRLGYTALFHAVSQENPVIVQQLILAGADTTTTDSLGRQPLYVACDIVGNTYDLGRRRAEADIRVIVQYLLGAGADPNYMNNKIDDQRRATGTVEFVLMKASQGDSPACVQMLLQAGAHVNQLDSRGSSALYAAVIAGREVNVNLLLNGGALVNHSYAHGSTALMRACRSISPRNATLCSLLLRAGASVNDADDEGCTALMKAVKAYNLACISMLLDHGASVELKDKRGLTALALAGNNKESLPVRLADRMGALLRNHVRTPSTHEMLPVVVHDASLEGTSVCSPSKPEDT